jgi:hypothetical protein
MIHKWATFCAEKYDCVTLSRRIVHAARINSAAHCALLAFTGAKIALPVINSKGRKLPSRGSCS